MSDGRIDIPNVNSPNFNEKVREALSVYLGNRGNPLDRGVTLRDLYDAGIISLTDGYLTNPSVNIPIAGVGSAVASAGTGGSSYVVDLTPPPSPTGFLASAGVTTILIEHDTPTYTSGNGHSKTRLYGVKYVSGALPTFSEDYLLDEFTGDIFTLPSNPATTWRLWIKWVTKDGVASTTPTGGVNGLAATTAYDVAALTGALAGQITASSLHATLGSRIDLIDAPTTGIITQIDNINTQLSNTTSGAVLDAQNARDAAIAAKTAAEAAAANAATAKTDADTAAANASTAKTAAEAALASANTAATTATTKATDAATYATNAATSATNASGSASTASTQAGAAATSATNAANSASAASTSATNAATSATAAGTSATAAGASATTATTKAGQASTSATNAATSETNAAGSATAAAASATNAAASATGAAGSATAAATSASNAATSATSAGTSASTATTQANTATTKAGEAATSATSAATSATNAAGSASSASTSATAAASSATAAAGSATAAGTSATTATTQATNAANSATTATTQANTATSQATNASNSATAASTSASNAATSATNAANSATAANNSSVAATSSFNGAIRLVGNSNFSQGKVGWSTTTGTYTETTGTIVTGGPTANSALQIAGPSTVFWDKLIAVDLAKSYRVRFRVKSTGTTNAVVYAGVATFDSTGTLETTAPGSHRYCAANAVSVPTDGAWHVYEGVITGGGNANHNQFRATTAFASPMFTVNSAQTAAFVCQVDECSFTDVTSELAAAASATAAATSASNAATSATAAGTSATSAQTSATSASTQAGNASTSAGQASTSATNAAGSASAAATSATAAANSATAASGSATAAATSASNAATSATSAGTSATTATTQANTATTKAGEAATSATSAATSATNAAGSATAANTSATNAAGSATAAGNSASAASTSASGAATSATNAGNSASAAATSATNAAGSATAAGNSASAASTSASGAATSASNAATSATSASTSANNASTSAGTASTQATNAASSATSASGSATNAATSLNAVKAVLRGSMLGLPWSEWTLGTGHTLQTVADGKVGNEVLRIIGAAGQFSKQNNFIPIDRNKTYRTRFWARPSATNTAGLLYFSLRQFQDAAGTTPGATNSGRSPYKPSGISPTTHNTQFGAQAWGEYSFTWTSADWQANVKYVQPEFLDNYSGAAGYWEIQGFEFTDATEATALVAVEASARANTDNGLLAQYTVKVDTNGYVSGYGLASTLKDDAASSTFSVRADSFYIANPAGSAVAPAMPFIVRTTAATINGVSVPVGVYLTDAFIQNGTITNAKIADATIDTAKIASLTADKISAGNMKVGSYIRSNSFTAGSAGWAINADGTAEFAAGHIRGQLTASQIDSRSLTIKDAAGTVLFGSGTNLAAANITPDAGWLNSNITIGGRNILTRAQIVAGGATVTTGYDGLQSAYAMVIGAGVNYRIQNWTVHDVGSYSISFWIKSSVATSVTFDLCDQVPQALSVTTAWQYVKVENLSVNSIYLNQTYFGFLDFNPVNACTLTVSNLMLEFSSKASSWSPAPEDTLNSNISIGSNGVLSGAGGGTVTAAGISAVATDLTNAPATILNSNVQTLSLVAGTGATVVGNTATKTGGTANTWDVQVTSKDSYTGGAFVSFVPSQTTGHVMVGLNTDPLLNATYTGIDYCWYCLPAGALEVYQSGTKITALGVQTYAVGDVLSITYDGSNVKYYKNGTVMLTTAATITTPLSLDSSFYTSNTKITNIQFGPMSSNNWADVTGTGKPADNATVGAAFDVNISGQITSTNVSTYIADVAIGTAQIANAAITSAKIGSLEVGTAHIAAGAITSAKIGNLEVGTANIAASAITSAKIGDLAVTTLKVGGGAITETYIASGSPNASYSVVIPSGQTWQLTVLGSLQGTIYTAGVFGSVETANLYANVSIGGVAKAQGMVAFARGGGSGSNPIMGSSFGIGPVNYTEAFAGPQTLSVVIYPSSTGYGGSSYTVDASRVVILATKR